MTPKIPEIGDVVSYAEYQTTNNRTTGEIIKRKNKQFGIMTKLVQDSDGVYSSFMVDTVYSDGILTGIVKRIYFLASQRYTPDEFIILGPLGSNKNINEAFPECFL